MQVVGALKESLETGFNARGRKQDGAELHLEEHVKHRDLFEPFHIQQRCTYVSETAYSIVPTDHVVIVDVSNGNATLLMPLSTSEQVPALLVIVVVGAGANTLTIHGQGGDLINGAATATLITSYAAALMFPIHNGWLCFK